MIRIVPLSLAALLVVGCGDDVTGGGGTGGGEGGSGGEGGARPDTELTVGGDRPVVVHVWGTVDPDVPAPLVILLHGYGASGGLQDVYFEMSGAAKERGMVFAAPDGTPDSLGRKFWNATDACCDFEGIAPDDSAYLSGLVEEIRGQVNIDAQRIYFAGHSNGGFMSHRMACDHADTVAAIISLAGTMHVDPADCAPSEPVSVLQIHGTADDTIFYLGGTNIGDPSPSAEATVATWVELDGCDATASEEAPLDLDASLAGAETQVRVHGGCDSDTTVALWTIEEGTHIPVFGDAIGGILLDFLLAHPK